MHLINISNKYIAYIIGDTRGLDGV